MEQLGSQKTLYPTQTYFQYSNLAMALAGEIIRERSGLDYEDYISKNILIPLGLKDTRSYYPKDLRGKQMAIGYTGLLRDGARDQVDAFFTRGITAAAGFTSSVNDLAKFASWQFALIEGGDQGVLNSNTLREMQRVHWVDPNWETTWGLGFNVRRVKNQTVVGHSGGCPGYITQFALLPKKKIAVIALTNAGDGPAWRIAKNTMATIQKAIDKASTPSEEDIPNFSRYEGNYDSRPWGGEIAVRQWGDQLVVIEIPGDSLKDSMTMLEHDSDNTFTRLTDDGDRREPWVFEVGDDGRTKRIHRHSIYIERID